jgi:hypothetical protein
MALPDISSIHYWAMWDTRKTPYYKIYKYCYYVPAPHDMYVFKDRKTNVYFAQNLNQLSQLFFSGAFRPFLLVTQKSDPTQGGVA